MPEEITKILIVDDEEYICRLLGIMLAREGHQCETALNAEQALELLSKSAFDLMLSDINMPGKNGIELLRIVHNIYPDMAVIMATAIDDRQIAIETLQIGAYGYVIKPFEKNELIISVANALRRRELEIANRRHSEELETLVEERTLELWQSREETIRKLAKAAEFRDNETAQHTIRMGEYCGFLAQQADLPDKECEMIRSASPLHDVGKIGIPDTILLKPGKLAEEEFATIKEHPHIGYRILGASSSEVLNLGAVIALTHHEKFNGKGYPGGLQGNNIPVVGRISAICDVFDALTSQRIYKAAMPVEDALDILKEGRGEHFDPYLLDIFLDNIDQMTAIRTKFADGPEF